MSKPKVDYTSDKISKETVREVAYENYAAGLIEGARRERLSSNVWFKDYKAKYQKLFKATEGLCKSVLECLSAIDSEMKLPSTPERGKKIAAICNVLEFNNDQVRYFALGVDYRKDDKLKTSRASRE